MINWSSSKLKFCSSKRVHSENEMPLTKKKFTVHISEEKTCLQNILSSVRKQPNCTYWCSMTLPVGLCSFLESKCLAPPLMAQAPSSKRKRTHRGHCDYLPMARLLSLDLDVNTDHLGHVSPLPALEILCSCVSHLLTEWACEALGPHARPSKADPHWQVHSSPRPRCAAPGGPCALQALWGMSVFYSHQSFVMVAADRHLVIIVRTIRAGPAMKLLIDRPRWAQNKWSNRFK